MECHKRVSKDTRGSRHQNKKIISLEVTSEEANDGKASKKLIDNASENNKVRSVLADVSSIESKKP